MSAEGGGLFNQGFVGQGFNWWIGQVADDSFWRDNINPGKFKDKQNVPGWGYRYKVRIFGLHDAGEGGIKSKDLPWANIMYPTTAGAYLQNSGQTPMIRQGNIVFGFFLDGPDQQQPVIMGVMGNNSQTDLATEIGTDRVTNTQPGTLGTSGYAKGAKEYPGKSAPTVSDSDKVVDKPKGEKASEDKEPLPDTKLNQFGLPQGEKISEAQQADIASAKAEIELIKQNNSNFSQDAQDNLIRKRVAAGQEARRKESESPRSKTERGATIESESPHIQTAATIKLDEVCEKKAVILKPTSIVESCNKAMQTDMDNMTQEIDKAMNALASYTDQVSITEGIKDLKKVIKDSSKQQAKYMKVVMDKVKQYTEKKLNKEMTKAVSALPACKRWQFMDLKDNMTQNMLSSFNGMSGKMEGMMEGILSDMLKVNDQPDGTPGLLSQALSAAAKSTKKGKKAKAIPRVPICAAEDAIASCIAANKGAMQKMNDKIISGMDGFIGDMMKEFADSGGGSITDMFSKLGDIKGNMKSALDFIDGGQDVFPFEVPPNEAVSDYYTFCQGGAGQKQTSLPSNSAINAAIKKVDREFPKLAEKMPFAEPFKNQASINLTSPGDFLPDFDIAQEIAENITQETQ
tara:strand:- start:4398 stop:6284 length:1887 start_codon:yes stop_codon:yes gene_type:complete